MISEAERFFRKHAGYSVKQGETNTQGRNRCARELAQAEKDARDAGFTFEWGDDWACSNHAREFGAEAYPDGNPRTCEYCQCLNADGDVCESLGCIDDANPEYRRVIEAELASEALAALADMRQVIAQDIALESL